MFRAAGFYFVVDDFLRQSSLVPYDVWRTGERKSAKRLHELSGFSMDASEAEMDNPQQQIKDAIAFLKTNHDELIRLKDFPGVETVCLDFAIEDRDVAVQCDSFPSELLRLAGNLDISIEVSRYPSFNEE
jgi:hypothetical protein